MTSLLSQCWKNTFKVLSMACVITGVAFFLGEFGIRVYLAYNPVYDIEMTRYSLKAKMDSPNPLIGHTHKPNVDVKLMGVQVHINSDGFRDREFSLERNPKRRIVLLGDSIAFGWGVEQDKTFKNIIETELNKVLPTEIINFGTGNYNTEQEVNLFLQKGLKYKPDQVVLFYTINDAEMTPKKSKFWFLGYSQLVTFYWSKIHALISNHVQDQRYDWYYAQLYKEDQSGWKHAQQAFLQLKEICQKNSIKLQVIMLPELHKLDDYPFKKEYTMVLSFLKRNGIEAFDLTPYFSSYKNGRVLWVANDDAHPNAKAHRLIAQYALQVMQSTGT